MERKLKVGILFGGKSAEHEISIRSAKNIIEAIDGDKYDVTLIGIDKEGKWSAGDSAENLLPENVGSYFEYHSDNVLALTPGQRDGNLVEIKKALRG